MKKNDMLKAVSAKSNLLQKDVDAVLTAFADVVLETLTGNKEEKVTLPTLGSFKVKNVPERTGTVMMGENAGSTWTKPQHNEICFKISKSVKEL